MKYVLFAALLFGAASLAAANSPPLCHVSATWEPTFSTDAGPQMFKNITVQLERGCVGEAHIRIGNYGGPDGTVGDLLTLTPDAPVLTFISQPPYRTLLWLAQSGKPYSVPLRRR